MILCVDQSTPIHVPVSAQPDPWQHRVSLQRGQRISYVLHEEFLPRMMHTHPSASALQCLVLSWLLVACTAVQSCTQTASGNDAAAYTHHICPEAPQVCAGMSSCPPDVVNIRTIHAAKIQKRCHLIWKASMEASSVTWPAVLHELCHCIATSTSNATVDCT